MRLRALICLSVITLCAIGCHKDNQTQTNAGERGVAPSDGLAVDRSQARVFVEKGKELYRSDADSEAAEAFRQAVKLDPDFAEAHFRLGLSYEALGKSQEAESEYKKAVENYKKYLAENPKDGEAHYDFGQTYAALSQYSDAIREYRQATKLKTDDPDIYYDLGTALTKLAQYDEAAAAFSKALELDPENYRAQDALDEAREGVNRIRAGRKHQEDLMKKQQKDELKKAGEGAPGSATPAASPDSYRT